MTCLRSLVVPLSISAEAAEAAEQRAEPVARASEGPEAAQQPVQQPQRTLRRAAAVQAITAQERREQVGQAEAESSTLGSRSEMAHFAQIDDNDIVQQVIVIANDDCGGGDFPESEPAGQAFIASLGLTGTWLQCSYNANFRGAYPGPGYYWNGTDFVGASNE
jgi:hypothetical protein